MKTHRIHLILAALCLLPGFLAAQTITTGVPGFISYQGRVLNNTGGLVGSPTPVNRTVIFRIWDHPSNTLTSNLIYSEQQTVTIADGEFSVLVGQGVATTGSQFGYSETAKKLADIGTAFGGSARYLGVTVDDGTAAVDNEITPRQQIVSSAFSFRAKFAETLGTSASTALTVVDSGNIGVGNTNPPARFTVSAAGTGTGSPQMVITADDTTERLRIGVDSTGNGTGYIQSFKEGTGAQNLLLNPSGGRVGIGTTTPAVTLDVRGTASGSKGQLVLVDSANASSSVASVANISGWGNNIATDTGSTGRLWYVGSASASSHDISVWNQSNANLLLGTNNAERIRITGSGNVGIGQTNPGAKLDVNGNINATGTLGVTGTNGSFSTPFFPPSGTTTLSLYVSGVGVNEPQMRFNRASDGQFYDIGMNGSNGFVIEDNDTPRLTINSAGNVGIGETNPAGKLVVSGNVGINTGGTAPVCPLQVKGLYTPAITGKFFNASSTGLGTFTSSVNYISLKSEWYVEAFGFIAVSDKRIKNVVRQSEGSKDLDTIQRLKVTDYRLIDRIQEGGGMQKGFIAQEVQEIIPEAVREDKGYVPGIYAVAEEVLFDAESKSLSLTMSKVHDLKVGEMVRLIGDEGIKELEVTGVTDDKSFSVGPVEEGMKRVFVYGKQVDDFLSVDYNRIFTTGISAIQQLKMEKDSEVKVLQEKNADLRARVKALEAQAQRLAELEANGKALEAKLAAIEKLLLENGKPAAQPVSIKKTANGAE